ncbi:Uncharacterised protein [Mycobacteroides abscessus subsp. abscessus]|nr:Uncharacterised protein [Mycobacteroides abscessus subsp. abscessus]SKU11569.1 Uncharacterised protein [Mycobacteroides abscessus subsp. abscessus]SKU94211.1 Uncharacterised protein [Mycobacteroides abscessus subsp. abscessus]SKV97492.1 Uncharacterised protein [Mycobacteroides abscessus subsp. abscessus]
MPALSSTVWAMGIGTVEDALVQDSPSWLIVQISSEASVAPAPSRPR